jgi:hypothetical protein
MMKKKALKNLFALAVSGTPSDLDSAVHFVQDQHHQRNLLRGRVECSKTKGKVEAVFKQSTGVDFDCSCNNSGDGGAHLTCTGENSCRGNLCGHAEQTLDYSAEGHRFRQKTCFAHESGAGALNGRTRCTEATFFNDGVNTTMCSCEANIDSVPCNGCEVCRDLPLAPGIQVGTPDCSNIAGGDFNSYDCEELETFTEEEIMEAVAQVNYNEADDRDAYTTASMMWSPTVIAFFLALML